MKLGFLHMSLKRNNQAERKVIKLLIAFLALICLLPLVLSALYLGVVSVFLYFNSASVDEKISKPPTQFQISEFEKNLGVGSYIYAVAKESMTDSGGAVSAKSTLSRVIDIDGDLVYISEVGEIQCETSASYCDVRSVVLDGKHQGMIGSEFQKIITNDELMEMTGESKIFRKEIIMEKNLNNALVYENKPNNRPISRSKVINDGSMHVYVNYYSDDLLKDGDEKVMSRNGSWMVLGSTYSFVGFIDKIYHKEGPKKQAMTNLKNSMNIKK